MLKFSCHYLLLLLLLGSNNIANAINKSFVDQSIKQYMQHYHIPGAALAIMQDGRVCRDARERFTPSLVQIDSHCATAN